MPRLHSARIVHAKNWHQRAQDRLKPGDRAADVLRNAMGSWRFVGAFILFMLVWAGANSVRGAWDPYPFILLNLLLSMLAGLQGAILLISARRQDAIAATLAQSDYETNEAAKTDIERLLDMNQQQLQLIETLCAALNSTQTTSPSDEAATPNPSDH